MKIGARLCTPPARRAHPRAGSPRLRGPLSVRGLDHQRDHRHDRLVEGVFIGCVRTDKSGATPLLPAGPAFRPAPEKPLPNPRPPAAFSVQVDTPVLILRSETRSIQLEVPALTLHPDRTKARRLRRVCQPSSLLPSLPQWRPAEHCTFKVPYSVSGLPHDINKLAIGCVTLDQRCRR